MVGVSTESTTALLLSPMIRNGYDVEPALHEAIVVLKKCRQAWLGELHSESSVGVDGLVPVGVVTPAVGVMETLSREKASHDLDERPRCMALVCNVRIDAGAVSWVDAVVGGVGYHSAGKRESGDPNEKYRAHLVGLRETICCSR